MAVAVPAVAAVPVRVVPAACRRRRRRRVALLVELDHRVSRVVGGDERRLGQRQRLFHLDPLQEPVAAVQGLLIVLASVLQVPTT